VLNASIQRETFHENIETSAQSVSKTVEIRSNETEIEIVETGICERLLYIYFVIASSMWIRRDYYEICLDGGLMLDINYHESVYLNFVI
jgi:hypothetical protein